VLRPASLFAVTMTMVAALGRPAGAEKGVSRFVVLTPERVEALPRRARMNLRSVMRIGSGLRATGFLVDGLPGVDEHGYLMTNAHVDVASNAGEPVQFFDGTEGKIVGTVLTSPSHDLRLLQVTLPPRAHGKPLSLRRGAVGRGEAVYGLSAAATPFQLGDDTFAYLRMKPLDPAFLEKERKEGRGLWTIQFSAESGNANRWDIDDHHVWSLQFHLANAFGASGSPVFSRWRHDVVGMHWGGLPNPGRWLSSAVPSHDILTEMEGQLNRGEVVGPAAEAIRRILTRATDPAYFRF